MKNIYKNQHYVPQWYQRRFIPKTQVNKELFYLRLKPRIFRDRKGKSYEENPVIRQGTKGSFYEKDLYTTYFGNEQSTIIEQIFFGEIDRKGQAAVEYFSDFQHPSVSGDAFNDLLLYMSTQKLRTPKGLKWLSSQTNTNSHQAVLRNMIDLRQLFCSIWTESVWQIADASRSNTKFIISDHPTTVYNKRCGPRSQWCREFNDPDIRFHASHTIFPLSMDKILILTNLSWVRNPYSNPIELRPNPNFFRGAMFKFTDIQTLRFLTVQEVREINFIIKSRAYNFIAASEEEWLYPEKYISKSDWNVYGKGYLLMPDPRSVEFSTEILVGYKDGSAMAIDEYGRRPWEEGYSGRDVNDGEFRTFYRFKGEFANLFGPYRRGRAFNFGILDKEKDTDEMHKYHLSLYNNRTKN